MKTLYGILAITLAINVMAAAAGYADNTYHNLAGGAFSQDWSNTGLITSDDNWAGAPSIIGYRGDGLVSATGVDPQAVTADQATVDVNANKTDPSGTVFNTGGVTEFEIANSTIAIKGSGTARAPFLLIHLNTTGVSGVTISYNIRDIDASARDTVSPFALQYRLGASGNFTNLPAGYVADATEANANTKITAVSATLPAVAENQAQVQARIITTDAFDADEFVGIDDIAVFSTTTTTTIASTTTTSAATTTTSAATTTTLPISVGGVVHYIGE